jgi:hypothetical protein
MLDECEEALAPLRSMLAADGYLLRLESAATARDALTVVVEAGPDACAECLVPVDLFTDIVARRLIESGLEPSVTVVYPDQSDPAMLPRERQESNEVKETES